MVKSRGKQPVRQRTARTAAALTPAPAATQPMLDQPSNGEPRRRRTAAPPQAPRTPFLKASDIDPRGATLVLVPGTVRTINGQYGTQLVIDVRLNGSPRNVFSWGINVNMPNLRLLVEHLISTPAEPIDVRVYVSANQRQYIGITTAAHDATTQQYEDEVPF